MAKHRSSGLWAVIRLLGLGVVAVSALSKTNLSSISSALNPSDVSSTKPNNSVCHVKGNISISSGRKLYHIPGMEDYEKTRISPEHGERWFCSEAEAIAAGWTKAPM